jgi:hypothetical protein
MLDLGGRRDPFRPEITPSFPVPTEDDVATLIDQVREASI